MARRVFFSFEYQNDVTRAMVVRKSAITHDKEASGFIDAAEFEQIQRQGDAAVRTWINRQLDPTTVTVVLVGYATCRSRWVQYEIEQSKQRGNGLLGVDVSKIKDFNDNVTTCCGRIPAGHKFYLWLKDDGYNNLGTWIETAAQAAGK